MLSGTHKRAREIFPKDIFGKSNDKEMLLFSPNAGMFSHYYKIQKEEKNLQTNMFYLFFKYFQEHTVDQLTISGSLNLRHV